MKAHQTIIQLQHDNNKYLNQIETYQTDYEKLQTELKDKQHVKFINFILNILIAYI